MCTSVVSSKTRESGWFSQDFLLKKRQRRELVFPNEFEHCTEANLIGKESGLLLCAMQMYLVVRCVGQVCIQKHSGTTYILTPADKIWDCRS